MRLILLGPPGSGKGTLSQAAADEYMIPHISTGDMFRSHRKSNSEFGKLIASYIDKGCLVPDQVVIDMVKDRLLKPDCKNGFLFDGFPRTVHQAQELNIFLKEHNLALDGVVLLDIADSALLKRLVNRRVCPKCTEVYHLLNKKPKKDGVCDKCGTELVHRPDDTQDVIQTRLDVYHSVTEPLIEFYKKENLLVSLDADRKPIEVDKELLSIFKVE